MDLTYRTEGDYQIPNLKLPAEETASIGKYGRLRHRYLQRHRRILYTNLKTTCALNQHLAEIDQAANEQMELLVRQMAAQQGVTEAFKATDQMQWIGLMSNIRQTAEEIILDELVYA